MDNQDTISVEDFNHQFQPRRINLMRNLIDTLKKRGCSFNISDGHEITILGIIFQQSNIPIVSTLYKYFEDIMKLEIDMLSEIFDPEGKYSFEDNIKSVVISLESDLNKII